MLVYLRHNCVSTDLNEQIFRLLQPWPRSSGSREVIRTYSGRPATHRDDAMNMALTDSG